MGKGDPIEWICNWRDKNNYVLFRLTEDSLERWEANGSPAKRTEQKKHNLDGNSEYTVEVNVRADSIQCSVQDKGAVKASVPHSGQNLGQGKFGFRATGGATIRIKDFVFIPSR